MNRRVSQECSLFEREAALNRLGGNEFLLKEFAKIFMEDTPEMLAKIQAAIQSESGEELVSSAHAIKGLVSNFGASDCVESAKRLEVAGRQQNFTNAEEKLESFRSHYNQLKSELHRYLDSFSS